jgi:hypothetical protein
VRFESIENDYETDYNRDQIARVEDVLFGTRTALELGWSSPAFSSDRSAMMLSAQAGRGLRLAPGHSFFLGASLSGRIEGTSTQDALIQADARYYWRTSPKTMFFAGLENALGRDLDIDHELMLGGDNGLRGYPLRYQIGSGRTLLTIEERFYTNRSLWHLAQIGGAVFFDAGRTWGRADVRDGEQLGLLKDVGFGLRLGNLRSALANVLHLDIAFPLDGDPSIDSVQFLVQTKASF